MEMNFPHKNLTRNAESKSAHHALLAHAIARQALSYSARAFVANLNGLAGIPAASRSTGLEDRMYFFAGEYCGRYSSDKTENIFIKGHFRPDLADEGQRGETA